MKEESNTLVYLVVLMSLFIESVHIVYPGVYMINNVSFVCVVVSGSLFSVFLSLYVYCCCCNPSIIPRKEKESSEDKHGSGGITEDVEVAKPTIEKKDDEGRKIPEVREGVEEISKNGEVKEVVGDGNSLKEQEDLKIEEKPDGTRLTKDDNATAKKPLSIYTERYCETCNIMRPPLASHCRECDHCINDFDQ